MSKKLNLRWIIPSVVLLSLSLVSLPAMAAKSALIAPSGGADILDSPNDKGNVLTHLDVGQKIKVSEKEVSGWHKVLLPEPKGDQKFGWVRSKDLSLDTFQKELKGAGIVMSRSKSIPYSRCTWYVGFTYGDAFVAGSGSQMSPIFTAEAEYYITETFGLGVQGGYFESNGTFYGQGKFLGLVADYSLYYEGPWRVILGGSGGLAMDTWVQKNLGASTQNSASFSDPLISARFGARWYAFTHLALRAELGYRYLLSKTAVIPAYGPVNANKMSAPFIEGGAQLEF